MSAHLQPTITAPPPDTASLEAECQRVWGGYVELLCAELQRQWGEPADEAAAIYQYALHPPGKTLRPILGLESTVAVGGSVEQVLPAVVGVECGHVASLIHDDIIDGDDTRRGRPSVHRRFGVHRAILAGDRLIVSMFEGLARCRETGVPDDRIVEALKLTTRHGDEICRGAMQELAMCGNASCAIDDYLEMARLKTAVSIRTACEGAAVLGGGHSHEIRALGAYGENIGIAFQIGDDLLTYDGDSEVMGKSALSDLRNRRPTLPVLIAYRSAGKADQEVIRAVLAGQFSPETACSTMRDVLHRTGALTATRRVAEGYLQRAGHALGALPATPARHRLAHLTTTVVDRDR